jgi:hypothetical protein
MRIWSIHPKYLDAKGIVALWREALLARNVLEGKTRGYRHHPQLVRFKDSGFALDAINRYLSVVYEESLKKEYYFDRRKIDREFKPITLTVTDQQLKYEMSHLLRKLIARDPERFQSLSRVTRIEPHPLFRVIEGGIEGWEVVPGQTRRD